MTFFAWHGDGQQSSLRIYKRININMYSCCVYGCIVMTLSDFKLLSSNINVILQYIVNYYRLTANKELSSTSFCLTWSLFGFPPSFSPTFYRWALAIPYVHCCSVINYQCDCHSSGYRCPWRWAEPWARKCSLLWPSSCHPGFAHAHWTPVSLPESGVSTSSSGQLLSRSLRLATSWVMSLDCCVTQWEQLILNHPMRFLNIFQHWKVFTFKLSFD